MLTSLLSHFGLAAQCTPPSFFGLKPWYYYLELDPAQDCRIVNFQVLGGDNGSDFILIALALIDDLLRIAGFVAIGYIIYGGALYLTSQGSPDQTGKAQSTIQNALIGLVIAIIAIAIVTFMGSRLA